MILLCKAWLNVTIRLIINVNNALNTGLSLKDGNVIVMQRAVKRLIGGV